MSSVRRCRPRVSTSTGTTLRPPDAGAPPAFAASSSPRPCSASRAACSSPSPATCRRSPRSTTTRRARSRACSAATARSSASSPSSGASVVPYDEIPARAAQRDPRRRGRGLRPALRPQHRRASSSRWRKDVIAAAARPARSTHHAAAGAQAVPHRSDSRSTPGSARSRKRSLAIQIEKRYTKRRDLHVLLQPDVLRARRLRRRGRVAAVLRQAGEGPRRSTRRR